MFRERLRVREITSPMCKGRRLHWFGQCDVDMWMATDRFIKKCQSLKVDGTCASGRSRKTWGKILKDNLKILRLSSKMTQEQEALCLAVHTKICTPQKKC